MICVWLSVFAAAHVIHAYELGDRGFTAGMVLHNIYAAFFIVAVLSLLVGEGT